MFLVGLTGGISTGKSSVATILRNSGIEIIDADLIAREVVEPGKRAWKKIRREFGDGVFHRDGTLNRQALGQIVFTDKGKRQILNSITHPEIYKSILFRVVKLFFCGHQFAVIDLPLLYESGKMVKYLHKTVVVVCEPAQQLERLMARDSLSESEALSRINAQLPLSEKAKRADFVINNSGTVNDTVLQTEAVIKKLQSLKTHWKYRILVLGCILVTATTLSVGPYMLDVLGGETCKTGGGTASDSFNEDGDSNSEMIARHSSPDDSLFDIKTEDPSSTHQQQQPPQQFRFSLDSLPHHHLSASTMNDLEMRMVVGDYQSL